MIATPYMDAYQALLAGKQAPTAQPTVEQVARTLFDTYHDGRNPVDLDLIWRLMNVGESGWMAQARAVLALLPGRPESVVKAEALREAADDYGINLTVANGPQIRSWFRSRADRIEAGQ